MTLNMTIIAPWGIWQSSDHRISRVRGGKVERYDDNSIKHLILRCSDGTALITYTGLGEIEGLHISDWLRKLVRGQSRTLDETLIFIREQATYTIAPTALKHGIRHIFNIGAFLAGKPWGVIISNAKPVINFDEYPPIAEFNTSGMMVEGKPITLVTGAKEAVTRKDSEILKTIAAKRPSQQKDFQTLLAGINRRASQNKRYGGTISKSCTTVYIPPQGEPYDCMAHGTDSNTALVQQFTPNVFLGIDMTEMMQSIINNVTEVKNSDNPEQAMIDFNYKMSEAAKKAITPKPSKGNKSD